VPAGTARAPPRAGEAPLTPPSLPRAQEVKEEPFFQGLDWQMVFLQKVRGTMPGCGRGYGGRGQPPLRNPSAACSTPRP